MKILQISASYKPAYIYGGPTMSVSKLSEQLVKIGSDVKVFTTTANGAAELPVGGNTPQNVDGVSVRYFDRVTKDHSHFSPQLLIALWKEVRSFDVVHIHAWWNLVSVLSCLVALLRKVPVIISPRGTLSTYSFANNHVFVKKILHAIIGRPLLSRCNMHTTSEREQVAIARSVRSKHIFTIHNFVAMPANVPVISNQTPETLRLLFFSRIDQKKGLEILLSALKDVSIPYRLTIAGGGDEAYISILKALSKQYQIDSYIDWIGFVNSNKFEMIAEHDLLVLPSYDENFANVVIESLSVGTAVLMSEEVGLAKYVKSKNLGWICKTNMLSIKSRLEEIYFNSIALNTIREQAPPIISNDFNENKLIIQYLEMYKQINRYE